MNMKNQQHPAVIGLLESLGLTAYIGLVAVLMQQLDKIVAPYGSVYVGITFVLMLFVLSALVSGSIILGYPILLAKDGKIKMGMQIVGYSMLWMFVIMLLGLLSVFIANN